jgi:hypothetical protein
VDPARARRLGPADQAQAASESRTTRATSRIWAQGTPGTGIEVHPQLVGMVQVVGPDRVRVEVDAAQVDDPGQPAASRITTSVGGPARRERQLDVSIQSGRDSGARFWKKNWPSAPLTKRLRAIGRPPGPAQRPIGHGQVVADEVHLRVRPSSGKKTLSGLVTVTSRPATSRTSECACHGHTIARRVSRILRRQASIQEPAVRRWSDGRHLPARLRPRRTDMRYLLLIYTAEPTEIHVDPT